MAARGRRIAQREHAALASSPPHGLAVGARQADEGTALRFEAAVCGPVGTAWEGARLGVQVRLDGALYPAAPPSIRFLDVPWHPAVASARRGR